MKLRDLSPQSLTDIICETPHKLTLADFIRPYVTVSPQNCVFGAYEMMQKVCKTLESTPASSSGEDPVMLRRALDLLEKEFAQHLKETGVDKHYEN